MSPIDTVMGDQYSTTEQLIDAYRQVHGIGWPTVALHRLVELSKSDFYPSDVRERNMLMSWAQITIGFGVTASWQPGPEIWAGVPEKCNWIVGRSDGVMDAWRDEPRLFPGQWWSQSGAVWHVGAELPLGIDWRLAIWSRPKE